MSGLSGLFSNSVKVDSSDFKYDPTKQKRSTPQQQPQSTPQLPFQSPVQLFRFDQSSNSNKAVGTVMFVIRPAPPAFQVLAYQNQSQPFISLQVTTSINFLLRNQIYGYLTDSQNIQWTIQFPNASTAARCAVTLAAILEQRSSTSVTKFDVDIGSGAVVTNNDDVTVSYIGFLGNQLPTTQAQFDANEHYSFTIGSDRTIKGYSQGVDGMRIGGSRVIIVPPELGYGPAGVGGTIPPNSILTFLITLKNAEIKQPPPQAQPAPQEQPVQEAPPAEPPRPLTTLERLQKTGAVAAIPGHTPESPRREANPEPPQPAPEPEQPATAADTQKRALFDEEDEAKKRREARSVMATEDENVMLDRLDELNMFIQNKFKTLTVSAPATMRPSDVVYEVQSLAAEIEEKERQLKEQQQIIDEMKKTKQNSKLRDELDTAQAELQALRSGMREGRDVGRENDVLKAELRRLKDAKLSQMETDLATLRQYLVSEHDMSQRLAETRTKELVYSFIGGTLDKLKARLVGKRDLTTREITGTILDVFQQSSEDVLKQIEERGIV